MVLSDQSDTNMSEAFRPSLEEAIPYQTKEECLDYIAQMGGAVNNRSEREQRERSKDQRIKFAIDVLRENLLPHVGVGENDFFKKAFFTGYMTNRLIQAALGRTTEDDRDYYGKKRLDMAGALLCNIFRQEFRKVITEMQKHLQKDINN
jgi:DNA-directed RNA polymerase II subunit RPB2